MNIINFPIIINIFFYKSCIITNGPFGTIILPQFFNNNEYTICLEKNRLYFLKKTVSKFKLKLITLLNNTIIGTQFLFSKKLLFFGVGFRVWLKQKNKTKLLLIKVGFSKDLNLIIPKNLIIYSLRVNILLIRGLKKCAVNQFSNLIRSYKKPDIFKGKGIQLLTESINLKQGKKN